MFNLKNQRTMTLVNFKNGNGPRNIPALNNVFGFPSFFSDTLERMWDEDDVNWMPSVNIKERADEFRIDLAVPGMNKEDFHVEVDNNVLTVSGERKEEKEDSNDKVTRKEFHYGAFKRSFSLPESANPEAVHASYKDGILSLTVAKKEELKRKPVKQITIA
jgi:HSP20 family protein